MSIFRGWNTSLRSTAHSSYNKIIIYSILPSSLYSTSWTRNFRSLPRRETSVLKTPASDDSPQRMCIHIHLCHVYIYIVREKRSSRARSVSSRIREGRRSHIYVCLYIYIREYVDTGIHVEAGLSPGGVLRTRDDAGGAKSSLVKHILGLPRAQVARRCGLLYVYRPANTLSS